MSYIYYETPRLIVRQWEPADATALQAIMGDARVHTYTGDLPWDMARTKGYMDYLIELDFRTLEIYHGACILKDTGKLIGFTGLNPYLPLQPELEWQLGVAHWGKGYASEVGRAAIAEAFRITPITAIYGMANPQNAGSMRALEKSGMSCLGLREFRGHMDMFYRAVRPGVTLED